MLCSGEQVAWAAKILESLDDTTTPTGSVVTWLKSNLGNLNLRINGEFYLSGDCIEPEMSMAVSGIYSEMFVCNWLSKQANKNLGAAAYAWVSIQGEDQGEIRRANRVESAKVFRSLANDCKVSLDELTDWFNGQQATFSYQIVYGDRFGGSSFDLIPPPEFYSQYNCIWSK